LNPKIKIKIDSGRITGSNESFKLRTWLNDCIGKSKTGFYEFVFKRYRKRKEKSNDQLEYLFGCVYKMIAQKSGDRDIRYMHNVCKVNFGLRENVLGLVSIKSLSEYTTLELYEYTEKIREWYWHFFGEIIPDPDPEWNLNK
jgi:hypothetical protein